MGLLREPIERLLRARHQRRWGLALCLYDVTTLYFEAEKEDELRKVGYSEEHQDDPQFIIGLLVDRYGFPLRLGCWEGNKAETTTIIPIVKAFQAGSQHRGARHRGGPRMLSAANLTALDRAHLRFIVGTLQVCAPSDLEAHFHWKGNAFHDG